MSSDYLTVEECDEIRRLHGLGLSKKEISKAVGRGYSTVNRVLEGKTTGVGPGPGRVPNNGMTELVEAAVVPWAPWVPEPEECAERVAELSVSQRHVLELMAAGYTFKQVARLRQVSESTARNLLNMAFPRLGVANYGQALILMHRAQAAV